MNDEQRCFYIIGKMVTYGIISNTDYKYLLSVDLTTIKNEEIKNFILKIRERIKYEKQALQ